MQASYQLSDLSSWPSIKDEAKDPANYVSAGLAGHYDNYEHDFDLLKKMNLNAYRFSVEWSRIEPSEGSWDAEAIEHYKEYVRALKKRGITPMLTLFHFTLPVWFAEKGGFEKRSNIKYFVRFAEKILNELGADIKYVITINEPETYAAQSYYEGNWPPSVRSKWRFYKVLRNLIRAHNKTAKMIHGLNRSYKVSIAKNSAYIYPGDNAWVTRLSAHIFQYFQDDYVIKRVRKTCDFLGVNYYFSSRVYGYRIHNPDEQVSDLGWDLSPENLQFVLERLHDKYKMPIIITENGLADGKDGKRKWWLAQTIHAMQHALRYGVQLEGYFHWSLMDNFEWAHGKWPRFGLIEVDYKTGQRKMRQSAITFSNVIKRLEERK